jgi:capsular polysaccharide transport system ATP-binding protein
MSIDLRNIERTTVHKGKSFRLFDGLNLHIDDGERVAILGPQKSGKSTLLRLICGTEEPDSGEVSVSSSISWPIPLATFFLANSTIAANGRFIARLRGLEERDFPRQAAESVGLGEFLNVKLGRCPPYAIGRLALALGILPEFDFYQFDGRMLPREKEFQEQGAALLEERLSGHGYILATATPKEAEGRCDVVYVLENGRATGFTDPAAGIDYFNEHYGKKKPGEAASSADAGDGDDNAADEGSGDIDLLAAVVSAIE